MSVSLRARKITQLGAEAEENLCVVIVILLLLLMMVAVMMCTELSKCLHSDVLHPNDSMGSRRRSYSLCFLRELLLVMEMSYHVVIVVCADFA